MWSVVRTDPRTGLLLFDEPSAYRARFPETSPMLFVDPFERLWELRGNKTMVFSSRRFRNLTRHLDLILIL